ncbi:MAG: 6-aminohexanoate-cyclic-dimer hydrolase [Gemmatimonadaceae bacterium]|nr:6-aminohexanoate-cyclic-dimer hydrolase [Gemmatimonadaceae bacterium]
MNDYSSYDALGLAQLVRAGDVAPRELVQAAIERIERLNPSLNAVVHTMYDRALQEAESELPGGAFRGVPILLKDLLAWYEGEPITSGSRLFRGWRPPYDTEIVRRYRRAGVIVVGKTNTPEFGLTPFTEPELFGPTRNPWDPARTPGGSSGGSAAAVASGMVPLAGGGDGGGSIRIPASCCGLFGLKPTRGRTPAGPLVGEHWQGATVEHCLTRSVRDSAAMLDALRGREPGAPCETAPPTRDYLTEVDTPPGRLRVAFTDEPLLGTRVDADCRTALQDAVGLLESLGHDVVERSLAVDREAFNLAFLTMICGETSAAIVEARDMIGRAATRADVEATTWMLHLLGQQTSAADFALAEHFLRQTGRRVGAFFENIDVLVTPTLGMPPFPIGQLQPPPHEMLMMRWFGRLNAGALMKMLGVLEKAASGLFDFIPFTPLFNVTGQPAMSVPLYWNANGLPIGVQIVGRFGDEATLFRLAGQLESARPWANRHPALWAA